MERIEWRSVDDGLGGDEDWIDGDDDIVTVGPPLPHVRHVEATAPLTLFVRYDDGVEGEVRFARTALHGVFAKLADDDYFKQVGIAHGAVSWPNEDPDMAPDAMHTEIVAGNGFWTVN
ncbi:DUF2442 domain-containing protein [Sphingomonas bacterium]|uniref:DUF2442 domain-containing protein n=1 Tax=Sphingomonas bacterium TaxID=1895847 RepID=UPI00157682C2|nr:DUF2442 domain-containing protein [Sphingomonas bacterium]